MKELVGPYRIQSVLGHGGMGIVYLGVHDHLGREVAIKALAPELKQHPQFRERFFAEARVQAKLQHTNIVTIYDLIEDAGSYFIVMESVPGPTLEELLKNGSPRGWEIEHTLALFQQVLAGLDYAHSKGVIHRDVKSSNVLIADGDQVKLTDFGIALLVGDKRLTASQSTIGTPTYMSPEQILRPREVDHRSDVYSAAIVLYEMLAGQPPFDAGTEYEIKKLQIEAPVPDLRTVNPKVPETVTEAISVAMRKDPDERFPSAGAFLRALREAVPQSGSRATIPVFRPDPAPANLTGARSDAITPAPPPPDAVTGAGSPFALLQGRGLWILLAAAVVTLLLGFGIATRVFPSKGEEEEFATVPEPSPSVTPLLAEAAPPEPVPAPLVSEAKTTAAPEPVPVSAPAVRTQPKPKIPPPQTSKKETAPVPDDAADRGPKKAPSQGPLRVGGAVSRPEKISGPQPVYPEVARKARLGGSVIIEAVIDEDGNVTEGRVLKGLPMGLDQAALTAVQNWKFRPATLDGQPVKVYYSVTVNFQVQ